MKYGVCCDIAVEQNVKTVAESGYDYIEGSYQMLVNGTDEQKKNAPLLLKEYDIPCTVVNCFLPGSLKTSGPERDPEKLRDYVRRGLEYGKPLGLEKVIFGSGGARNVENGYDFYQAFCENAAFLGEIVAPLFKEYDVILAIEPLAPAEVNLINTVKEGAMLAAASGADNIFVLADIYHMVKSGDAYKNILDLNGVLRHAHISNPQAVGGNNRVYMTDPAEFDYVGFLSALRKVGCDTCSVEASIRDITVDAPAAHRVLKSLDAMLDAM